MAPNEDIENGIKSYADQTTPRDTHRKVTQDDHLTLQGDSPKFGVQMNHLVMILCVYTQEQFSD